MAEVVLRCVPAGVIDMTIRNENPSYWVRRRSAASVEACWFSVQCVLVQIDRGRCAVFMGTAGCTEGEIDRKSHEKTTVISNMVKIVRILKATALCCVN